MNVGFCNRPKLVIKIFIQHTSTAANYFRIITITSHTQKVLTGFSAVWDLRIVNKAQQSVAHKAGSYISLADTPEGLKRFLNSSWKLRRNPCIGISTEALSALEKTVYIF